MDPQEAPFFTGSLLILSFMTPFIVTFMFQWTNAAYREIEKAEERLRNQNVAEEPFKTLKKYKASLEKTVHTLRLILVPLVTMIILSIMCIFHILVNIANFVPLLGSVQSIPKREIATWLFSLQMVALIVAFLIGGISHPLPKLNKLRTFMTCDQEPKKDIRGEKMVESQGRGLRSRKLWVAIVGIILLTLLTFITPVEAIKVIAPSVSAIIAVYLLSQGYADGQAAKTKE